MILNCSKKEIATTGFGGICLGLVAMTGLPAFTTIAIAGLISVPTVAGYLALTEPKRNKKYAELETKFLATIRKLDSAELKIKSLEIDLAKLLKENEQISVLKSALEFCRSEYQKSFDYSTHLNEELKALRANTDASDELIERLEDELEELQATFEKRLLEGIEKEVATRQNGIMDAHFQKHKEHTERAIAFAEAYKDASEDLFEMFERRKEISDQASLMYCRDIKDYSDSFSSTLEKVEYANMLQIEQLQERLAIALQRIEAFENADLLEPEYLSVAYSIEGRIANDIAKEIFNRFQVPLVVKGYHTRPDGVTEVGYTYSRSLNLQQLLEALSNQSKNIADSLRINKIVSIKKLEIADLIVLTFRRDAAIKQDEIKRLLTPVNKLAKKVLLEMSQKSTLRIMGATGSGKGILAKYLLSQVQVYHSDWYIRLHDPQHGSTQDYWEIPKVSKTGKELQQALKNISNQMIEREASKKGNPTTLDILDEIDTQLEKEDKVRFLDLICRIRHLNMNLILIGQNPKVARACLQWSDMAQLIAFYMGASAQDAIKNNPALELKRDMLLKQYEELSEAMQGKNELLDDAKKHYFGLCVIPDKAPIWFELPVTDDIEIDASSNMLGETFALPVSNSRNVGVKKSAKTSSPSGITNSYGDSKGGAETTANKGMARLSPQPDYAPYPDSVALAALPALPTCKKHNEVKLAKGKDGRFYCKGCKKKLTKSEYEYRD